MINTLNNNTDITNKLKETLTINSLTSQLSVLQSENTYLQQRVVNLINYIKILDETYIIKDSNGNIVKYSI
jgi:hypothetical protein